MKILKAKIDRSFLDKDCVHGMTDTHGHKASGVKPEGETLLTIRGIANTPSSLKRELVAAGFEPGEDVVIMSAADYAVFRRVMET